MGAPLSPGPGPRFSSLITFPSGLRSLDGWMQFPHWSGRARRLHDQVSRWVEGAFPRPRTRPQGQLDQPQHLGADRCTPPHPSPRSHRLCPSPPDSAPASALWHPKPTRLPHLSSPRPHSPSLSLPVKTVLSLPDPAGVPHPLRDLQNHSFSLNWEKNHPSSLPWPPSAHG